MKTKLQWSPDRPKKPDVDPLFEELVGLILADPRSTYAKANVSGLSAATFKNWTHGKVRRPQAVSMQMAARMLGLKMAFIKEETKNGR